MEPNFQTSFIPKKPIVEERAVAPHSVGFLVAISLFILFTVLLVSAGLYFYKGILTKNIAQMENTLNLAKNRFEPSKIAELQVLDKRLRASSEILSHHIALTPVFQALQTLTMKTVRYTKFSYTLGESKNAKIVVKMNGLAIGYRSIALQSDLFAQNKNLIDPVFSNLTLDDKGNVLFDLEFSVDPSFVDYKQMLLTQNPI
ncbi:MAG: hypothetical protein Q7K54_01680 [Candidatus Parcubacteria bacterium]|nr:hypothetical protein [Candidatus Parcubacteria bacterium]